MVALANVVLSDTFDTWRTRTNQIIVKLDQLETNAVNIVSNTSVITVVGRGTVGNTVYLSSNALPNTGGAITGSLTISSNLSITNNTTTGNLTVTSNTTLVNLTVSGVVSGVLNLL